MTHTLWLKSWQRFDGLYRPHTEDLQSLIQQHAERFELVYSELDDQIEQESFIGRCYKLAQEHDLPLSLVDWWRTLQVHWVDDEYADNFSSYPDMLQVQGNRFVKYQQATLRAFRIALADEDEVEIMFLAAMLEAIRAAEAQYKLWNNPTK